MFSLGVKCPYGKKCSFAHGSHELKEKPHVPARYKTVKCRDFHENGCCKFGSRCQFLHLERRKTKHLHISKMNYSLALKTFQSEAALKNDSSYTAETFISLGLNLVAYKLPRLAIFESLSRNYTYV